MRLVSARRKDSAADSAVWRAPGTDDRCLQIPFGLHWSAVTASCFKEIGDDGQVLSGTAGIENLPVQLV